MNSSEYNDLIDKLSEIIRSNLELSANEKFFEEEEPKNERSKSSNIC